MPFVVLLDMNSTALGIVRNLHSSGFEILAFCKKDNHACSSRFLSSILPICIEDEEEHILQALIAIGKYRTEKGFLITSSDIGIEFLSANRKLLEQYYTVGLANEDVLWKICDKYSFYKELVKLSLKTPASFLINDSSSIDVVHEKLGYPCILKPVFSGNWKTSKSSALLGDKKAVVIRNEGELRKYYKMVATLCPRVIAQEIIKTDESGSYSFCCYADRKGGVLWGFVTQKVLMYPKGFGTAILCQTISDREVYALGKKVVESLGVDGISETEIIRDSKSGALYVIEINTRHWMQHRLSTRLGVNLTLLDYYFRNENMTKVDEILSGGMMHGKPVIIVDEVGYLFHCIKHFFRFNECRFKMLAGKHLEYSTFSVKDWRPFYKLLKTRIFQNINILKFHLKESLLPNFFGDR